MTKILQYMPITLILDTLSGTDKMLTHFFYFQETRKFQYLFLTPLSLENLSEEKEDVNVVYFKKNEG